MKSIKNWIEEDRPREKMMLQGSGNLTSTELLAILIQGGTKEKSAMDLARDLLDAAKGKLGDLARFSFKELTQTKGIGTARAAQLSAAFELCRRMESEIPQDHPQISSSSQAAAIMIPHLRDLPHEECWVMFLNRANRFIGKERVSSGGVSSTVIDIKLILRKAIEKLAGGIILFHNHPSGTARPGKKDIEQTEALQKAASLMDMTLLDHIIVGRKDYFSFSDSYNPPPKGVSTAGLQ